MTATGSTDIATPGAPRDESSLSAEAFLATRRQTTSLAAALSPEDMTVQSMTDASPAKWHLAHTTWFFEAFILEAHLADYKPFHPHFSYLFNSYYNAMGDRHPRPRRGMLTRPGVDEVLDYRRYVDDHIERLLGGADAVLLATVQPLLEIGLNHEQQHQELLLTDVKHLLWCHPLWPAYREGLPVSVGVKTPMRFVGFDAGVYQIGHEGEGFAYDNELPRHRIFLEGYELADRLVTNREYEAFIADGGYRRAELWLDDGWAVVEAEQRALPLYWREGEGDGPREEFTLGGGRLLDPHAPVSFISFYEADAYARWAGCRLPTEGEWEVACLSSPADDAIVHGVGGGMLEDDFLHPAGLSGGMEKGAGGPLRQMIGHAWEWTRSDYAPYPGYEAADGALGEYNGKFMSNKYVLRGGSSFTPRSHIRATYRNFFPADARWQCTGIRLARDVR